MEFNGIRCSMSLESGNLLRLRLRNELVEDVPHGQ